METMTWKEYLEDLLNNSTERTEQERLEKQIKEIEEKEKNKNKVYLVWHNWSYEPTGQLDMIDFKVFDTYEKAKNYFNKIKKEIINKDYYNLNYDYIDNQEDFYCESVEGEYLYYHDLVSVRRNNCYTLTFVF